MGYLGHMSITGVIRDYFGTMLRAFFKQAGVGLAINAKILALLKGLP